MSQRTFFVWLPCVAVRPLESDGWEQSWLTLPVAPPLHPSLPNHTAPGLLLTENWVWQGCSACLRTHRIPGHLCLTSPQWTDLCFLQSNVVWGSSSPIFLSFLLSEMSDLGHSLKGLSAFPWPFPPIPYRCFLQQISCTSLWFWHLLFRGPKLTRSLNIVVSISLGKTQGYKSWGPWSMYVCVYLSKYLFNFLLV